MQVPNRLYIGGLGDAETVAESNPIGVTAVFTLSWGEGAEVCARRHLLPSFGAERPPHPCRRVRPND